MSFDYTSIKDIAENYTRRLKDLGAAQTGVDEYYESVAEKERDYTKYKSKRYLIHKTDKPVTEAKLLSESDAADLKYDLDIAKGMLKAALGRIKHLEKTLNACQSFLSLAKAQMNIR